MIAAIYARKSTPQEGRHVEEKSVTRQRKEARDYIERKGWVVGPVFEDDEKSGKLGDEHRPGLRALLRAAEAEPRAIDLVVMSDDSRLSRDQWKASVTLSRLHEANVKLYYYQEDREVNLGTATGRFMEAVRGYASAQKLETETKHMVDGRAQAQGQSGLRDRRKNIRLRQRADRLACRAAHQHDRGRRRCADFRGLREGPPPQGHRHRVDPGACADAREGGSMDEGRCAARAASGELSRRGRFHMGNRNHPGREARAPHHRRAAVATGPCAAHGAAGRVSAPDQRPPVGPPVE
jgi:DNA invertase Pin-like site-specific DNA recombinase